ncbi:hypothetical protein K435DRAFT_876414 [Dendrothele bispora CBS 962.96]|uniref:Uncharacterized protein n=1 Tax=Dendrothele bispora (strain CBS 962.96) TaxID=1314807 RepID=A0A4S8KS54_DENBC|nr:hypothetical protein K435DRAFT_876414 [Dendrothele bispora CBS 962.96]
MPPRNPPFSLGSSRTKPAHDDNPSKVARNLLEAVRIANRIQDMAKRSTRNGQLVEKRALRASKVVSSAQEKYLQLRARIESHRSNSGLDSTLAFGVRLEDLLEHLENIERDLEIHRVLDDVGALINKEKDLKDHYNKLKTWETKFNLAAIKVARMTRHKRERTGTNEANRTNSCTTPIPEPAHVGGNSQKVTMTFSSSNISDPVINNCGGDSISTSNVHAARITIAKKVVNVKHYHACSTKVSFDFFMEALGAELAPYGIDSLLIQPGFIYADWGVKARNAGKGTKEITNTSTRSDDYFKLKLKKTRGTPKDLALI